MENQKLFQLANYFYINKNYLNAKKICSYLVELNKTNIDYWNLFCNINLLLDDIDLVHICINNIKNICEENKLNFIKKYEIIEGCLDNDISISRIRNLLYKELNENGHLFDEEVLCDLFFKVASKYEYSLAYNGLSEEAYLYLQSRNKNKKNRKVKLLKTEFVKKYCKETNSIYKTIIYEENVDVFTPQFFLLKDEKHYNFKLDELYIAELKDAEIIGGENCIITKEGYCLYDLIKKDDNNIFDLRSASINYIDKEQVVISYTDADYKIEEGIKLSAHGSLNYFHFMIEVIPKLLLINEIKEYDNFPIIVDDLNEIEQLLEILKIANIKNRRIIFIKNNTSYLVGRLIAISNISILPINVKKNQIIKPEHSLIPNLTINLLKNLFRVDNSKPDKKIFISRKNSKIRRLKNEAEIMELFEDYGFEVVYTEKMSILEQEEMFSNAEFIAGITGAAFTNIIFAPEKSKIITITPLNLNFPWYYTISKKLNQSPICLDAEMSSSDTKALNEIQMIAKIEYVEKFLESLNIGKKEENKKCSLQFYENLECIMNQLYNNILNLKNTDEAKKILIDIFKNIDNIIYLTKENSMNNRKLKRRYLLEEELRNILYLLAPLADIQDEYVFITLKTVVSTMLKKIIMFIKETLIKIEY